MNIYSVKPDTEYRLAFPEDAVYESDLWSFKCEPLAGKLPLHFEAYFSETSNKPLPDIAWLGMSTFAFREDVAEALLDILENSGELLPFKLNDDIWYCLNILEKADAAVDRERSQYEFDDGSTRFGLKDLAFFPDKLPKTSLFKIKDDNYTNIYCQDRRGGDEEVMNNFFCAVSAHKFTGIRFEEIATDLPQ